MKTEKPHQEEVVLIVLAPDIITPSIIEPLTDYPTLP